MEGGYSSDQLERKGSKPTPNEDPGILESSILFTKRNIPEVPEEEEEESQAPLREQDLKETYIQLVQGVQEWQDGCVYRGHFGLDMKLGYGEFSWPTGESYHGQFYRDHRHGFGTYMWPDGSSFTGMFYLSYREGYGTMYMKARLFQGLYKADERFGPGIETYPDGCQDVGLWFREHLIKLCTEIPCSFSISCYPEFEGFLTHSPVKISLSEEETMHWDLHEEQDPFFYDYKQLLLNDDLSLSPEVYLYSTDNTHMPITRSFRRELDSRIFLNDIPPFVDDGEPWFIKNETPLMVKMQKHAYKFRNKKEHSSWNMGAILEGDRSSFACRGPKERLAREMILKAEEGNYDWICGILRDNLASPDVADARGYTVLAAAAVNCHINIVNLLLDNGADVNKCTDEGLTPLNMCFLLYYPATSFRPNIAERTVPLLQCFPKEVHKLSGSHHYSFTFHDSDSVFNDDLVPSPESQKSTNQRDSLQKWEPTLPRGSVSISDQGVEEVLENLDHGTQCSSETNFESNLGVHNYSIELSFNILEKSAKSYSFLKVPFSEAISDKGTMRQMAWTMIKHRNRWLTIKRLLHRGADPNLCRVPMQVLFFSVKAGDVDGVKLLLESGARTDIQLPPELMALTPLHIAAALPGEEGVKITELLLHAITDVDARATDQDDVYRLSKPVLFSSMKLNNEGGPPSIYSRASTVPEEGGRTALHVACEREDNYKYARDVVHLLLSHKANSSLLWGGHSPLSLSIASGNDLIVKELLSHGADPNQLLTKGLGSALCVVCDIAYEHRRSVNSRLNLIDLLINYGADVLAPVTLTQGDKMAVGTVVDYGYFKFFQDRKIAHCPFHTLMPAERETFVARKRLLEYMGFQLRRAVMAKESQWDPQLLYLSKRAQLIPCHRLKQRGSIFPKDLEEQEQIPFFKFCYQCGRSIGVRLLPCSRCYGILICSKSCKIKAWTDFHSRDCGTLTAIGENYLLEIGKKFKKPMNKFHLKEVYTGYNQE
ncbi:ankyrin repeat and MYND domain-containing protein 1 [Pipistrellus kuhlii]|uniref:ankyrin repeat and MYND domain-containing protein 1 n=1 Tax=Pipistrellus kuhlii TaxID=59472 RepID=UPI001E271723|nr:ankyrin repeat and MYND domain-containing protein 1 [Pipistrellus kuhlii]